MCPPNVLQDTMKLLTKILKSPGCRKIPVIVQNSDDVVVSATNFISERCVFGLMNGPNLNSNHYYHYYNYYFHLPGDNVTRM